MKQLLLILVLIINYTYLQANEGSVVCIHGFIRSYKCMIPMGNTLENEGFDVYLWDYCSRRNTIEGHADHLVALLNVIAKNKPGQPIHFVTHSLGGLITKTALNHPNCPEEAKIGKAVLLAPPAQGSSLARSIGHLYPIKWVFGKKAGYQLITYTKEDMAALGEFPPQKNVLVIAGVKGSSMFFDTPNDGKVTLEETKLSTPHAHYVLYVNHTWIMTSRESIAITKKFLTH